MTRGLSGDRVWEKEGVVARSAKTVSQKSYVSLDVLLKEFFRFKFF